MAIDYTSYPAWNDPYNPWVRFNTLTLSAAEVSLRTFTLTVFDPKIAGEGIAVRYQDNAGTYYLDYDLGSTYGNGPSWNLFGTGELDVLYFNDTAPKGTPLKVVGVVGGWTTGSAGSDESLLYINPTRPFAEWEKRRKRILGYK